MSAQSRNRRHKLVAVIACVALGVTSMAFLVPDDDDLFKVRKNFQIFGSMYQELVAHYVDEVDAQEIMRVGMRAMLAELDPYTTFFDEATNDQIRLSSQGNVANAGIQLELRQSELVVATPSFPLSAYARGIRPGDVISTIGGNPAVGLTLAQAYALLSGDENSLVTVEVDRPGNDTPLEFVLRLEKQRPKNVGYAARSVVAPTVIIIKLNQFGRNSAGEVRKALKQFADESDIDGLILDLRGNPGGILSEAVELCGMFLPTGSVIVTTRSKTPERNVEYRTENAPAYLDLPVTVLVSETSASASEIVAGALQDMDRAVILGAHTYGKGLTQIIRPLPFNTSLKVTNDRFYLPSDRTIQRGESPPVGASFKSTTGRLMSYGNGVSPDVVHDTRPGSELETQLQQRSLYFRYAQDVMSGTADDPGSFSDDVEFVNRFRSWSETKGFTYSHPGSELVAELRDTIESSESIDDMLEPIIQADIDRQYALASKSIRSAISMHVQQLRLDPVDFYEWKYGVDEAVNEARSILLDQQRYSNLLSGN